MNLWFNYLYNGVVVCKCDDIGIGYNVRVYGFDLVFNVIDNVVFLYC